MSRTQNLNANINFGSNLKLLRQKLPSGSTCDPAVVTFLRACKPVHRCSIAVLMKILAAGGLRSRHDLEKERTTKNPKMYHDRRIKHNKMIQALIIKYDFEKYGKWRNALKYNAIKYVQCMVQLNLKQKNPIMSDEDLKGVAERNKEHLLTSLKDKGESCMKDLEGIVAKLTKDFTKAKARGVPGLGHPKDITLGTNKHVFATLGANSYNLYGPVYLILKRDILLHPDCNMTPVSGILYYDPNKLQNRRPWSLKGISQQNNPENESTETYISKIGKTGKVVSSSQGVRIFHQEKLSGSLVNWEETVGADITRGMTRVLSGDVEGDKFTSAIPVVTKKTGITAHDIIETYLNSNGHCQIEVHLPSFVPLDIIEKIIIVRKDCEDYLLELLKKIPHGSGHLFDVLEQADSPLAANENLKTMWYPKHVRITREPETDKSLRKMKEMMDKVNDILS